MKMIYARTNPAFKRTQLLPVILNRLPPATDVAARPFGFISPATATGLSHPSRNSAADAGAPIAAAPLCLSPGEHGRTTRGCQCLRS